MAELVALGHLKINDENSGVDPKYDDNTKEKSPQTEASSRYDHDTCIEELNAARRVRVRNWMLYRQQQFPNKDGDEIMAEGVALGHLKINDENSGVDHKYITELFNKYKEYPCHDHDKCIEKQRAARAVRLRNWMLYRERQFENNFEDEFISIQAQKEVLCSDNTKREDQKRGCRAKPTKNSPQIWSKENTAQAMKMRGITQKRRAKKRGRTANRVHFQQEITSDLKVQEERSRTTMY